MHPVEKDNRLLDIADKLYSEAEQCGDFLGSLIALAVIDGIYSKWQNRSSTALQS